MSRRDAPRESDHHGDDGHHQKRNVNGSLGVGPIERTVYERLVNLVRHLQGVMDDAPYLQVHVGQGRSGKSEVT